MSKVVFLLGSCKQLLWSVSGVAEFQQLLNWSLDGMSFVDQFVKCFVASRIPKCILQLHFLIECKH